jgi:2-methylcitrate dehydratase PrpD
MSDAEHVEKAFDFGGMPARNGATAATFVSAGFTAVEDVFEGERNFYVAYGGLGKPALLGKDLGRRYEIMNTNIKRWSVGSPIQAPLDSLLHLIRTHSVRAEDVEHVEVRVSITGANTTDNRHMPDICMQHMVACMLLDGIVTFESSHDEARMKDPKVLALRKRVTSIGDPALQKVMPSRQGIVTITTKSGRKLRHHTKAVRGTAQNPMTRAEVDEKCYHLLAPVLGKARARRLVDTVWSLEKVKDVRALRPLLRA